MGEAAFLLLAIWITYFVTSNVARREQEELEDRVRALEEENEDLEALLEECKPYLEERERESRQRFLETLRTDLVFVEVQSELLREHWPRRHDWPGSRHLCRVAIAILRQARDLRTSTAP